MVVSVLLTCVLQGGGARGGLRALNPGSEFVPRSPIVVAPAPPPPVVVVAAKKILQIVDPNTKQVLPEVADGQSLNWFYCFIVDLLLLLWSRF